MVRAFEGSTERTTWDWITSWATTASTASNAGTVDHSRWRCQGDTIIAHLLMSLVQYNRMKRLAIMMARASASFQIGVPRSGARNGAGRLSRPNGASRGPTKFL